MKARTRPHFYTTVSDNLRFRIWRVVWYGTHGDGVTMFDAWEALNKKIQHSTGLGLKPYRGPLK